MAKAKDIKIGLDTSDFEHRIRDILENARHPKHYNEVVEMLAEQIAQNTDDAIMGVTVRDYNRTYYSKGFPAWINVEEDLRRRSTLLSCDRCGEIIHTISYEDKVNKNRERIREEVLNAIGYHADEECFPGVGPIEIHKMGEVHPQKYWSERKPEKMRGRDLPINIFDFPADCQVRFLFDEEMFFAKCSLCGAHVCTKMESDIDDMLRTMKTSHVVDLFVSEVKNCFRDHVVVCKMLKRQGLRHIRTDIRRKK